MKEWLTQEETAFYGDLSAEAIADIARNYEQEAIHCPGLIQPHGILFVLAEPKLKIRKLSENASDILGIPPEKMLGMPLAKFIGTEQSAAISSCLDRDFEHINPLDIQFAAAENHPNTFNGIVHRAPDGQVVLELEPRVDGLSQDFFQFARRIKSTLAKIQSTGNLFEMCNLVVHDIRELTGLDRVMVYRFADDGNGVVIAEAKRSDLEPFYGLHYPALDIPKQARDLFVLNWLRLIVDVDCQATGLLPVAKDEAEEGLDMSHCVLRAVSPCHLQYLRNMGVGASMSISLIKHGRLWGLIACHHETAKFISYEIRTICEFLGQLMSVELATKEEKENLDYRLHLKDLLRELTSGLTETPEFLGELTQHPELLVELAGANGVAVCEQGEVVLIGKTPTQAQVMELLPWLDNHLERDLYHTNALSLIYPQGEAFKAVGSGLLAIAISRMQQRYLLWFRPEVSQTVVWAGNPASVMEQEADGLVRLSPRGSFEEWREELQGRSQPWLDCEISSVIELRQMIVDIILRHADELAEMNQALERSNSELDSFAYIASHDLKEPLRGIHNYATFLVEDYGDILAEEGREQLYTLVRLTKRLESLIDALLRFSRLGRQELHREAVNLNELIDNVGNVLKMNPNWANCEIRIVNELPVVFGDRPLVEEIFSNLISNGFKYNKNDQKYIEIGSEPLPDPDATKVQIYVQDNGIGIRPQHIDTIFRIFKRLHPPKEYGGGSGVGLTIVKKIVERHGGAIAVTSVPAQGSRFMITLPSTKY